MRKARIILSLIIVLATVGGMLAFKAKHFMAVNYYTCNTIWYTCQRTWTIGGFITTIWDPVATLTVTRAATDPAVSGVDCADACTLSNFVYIESGF